MAFISAADTDRQCRSFNPLLAALALAAAVFFAAPHAAFAADEIFTVANVAVDATAATAAVARERAIQDGQRRALIRLLQRLSPQSERPKFPQLSDTALADLVRDFEIGGEKTSSVRYIASLTVRFKPSDVRAILRQRGIAFSETPSKPVLVLPVYDDGAGATLFEDNPWRGAWAARVPGDGLVMFLLPRNDAADAATITAEQAMTGNGAALRALAAHYGVADVLVAVVQAHPDEASGHNSIDVSASRFGTTEESVVTAFAPAAGDANPTAVFDRAAAAITDRIEESWKQASLLHFDSQREISVRVPLGSLNRLVTVMRGLDGLAPIQRVDLIRVAYDEADLHVRFLGEENQLTLLLAQRDLALSRDVGGYVLRSTTAGPGGQP